MRVLSLLNQKGGVGKTSTCHHLAGALSRAGRRVLLVDNDPQSSLTQGLFGSDWTFDLDPTSTVGALYSGLYPVLASVIRPTSIPRVDLVPGSRLAGDWNVSRPHLATGKAPGCLQRFLARVEGSYDVTLIDCPPNLHLCSWAALAASDRLIIPVQAEVYGVHGIAEVLDFVESVNRAEASEVEALGILVNRGIFRRTNHRLYEGKLREIYGDLVFRTRIPDAAAFVEAVGRRMPVEQYQPRCAAASSMRALAVEVFERLDAPVPVPVPPTPSPAEAI